MVQSSSPTIPYLSSHSSNGSSQTFNYRVYLSRAYWSDENDDALAVAETIMSPAKYALFAFLGFHLVQTAFLNAPHPDLSATISAKVGASGGVAFWFLHLSLFLLRRNNHPGDLADDEPLSKYVLLLSKEVVYSAAASIIGALVSGMPRDYHTLSFFAMAGLSGPFVFLVIWFGALGLVMGIAHAVDRLKTWWWWTRY